MKEALRQPGKELDALVAEKVMGWRSMGDLWITTDENIMGKEWSPSTNIEAAWMVFLKVFCTHVAKSSAVISWCALNGKWSMALGVEPIMVDWTDTAPHVICLAALKVVGV